jgi:hypothetical protein
MKFGLDTTQMIALGAVILFLLFALKKVSGYVATSSLVQDPSDVDLNKYNAQVAQYTSTMGQWLSGVISPGM